MCFINYCDLCGLIFELQIIHCFYWQSFYCKMLCDCCLWKVLYRQMSSFNIFWSFQHTGSSLLELYEMHMWLKPVSLADEWFTNPRSNRTTESQNSTKPVWRKLALWQLWTCELQSSLSKVFCGSVDKLHNSHKAVKLFIKWLGLNLKIHYWLVHKRSKLIWLLLFQFT